MRKFPVILLLIVAVLSGCGAKRMAKGPSDVVYVVASEAVREKVRTAIDTTFSFGIRTPEFQHYYMTSWQSLDRIREYLYYPHTIVVVDMNVNDVASRLVKGLLSEDRLESIKRDTVALFALPNTWQDVQTLIIAAAYDVDKLSDFIMERQGWLYSKIDQKYFERQSRFLFGRYEQKDLSRKLENKYGWTMRMPSDFQIIHEYHNRNFVWLGRALPYRWISVSWANGIKTEWLTANGLFQKREAIGSLYGQVKTEKRFLGHKFVKLEDWDALRMWGLWYHEEDARGGPFMTYAFYDHKSDKTYVIDMLVYSPGEKTVNYLRQMEIMARTFRTTGEEN
ncbi:DUF4837 family protein [bacterium]|nr:DUF4837 family protein [bacterium]MBU1635654.1 DUF4837 family protein [bacterium]MBU1872366.1 DUF4837 family protein [bacterium]